jgi:hypothetical protein
VPSERWSVEERSIEYCGWACCVLWRGARYTQTAQLRCQVHTNSTVTVPGTHKQLGSSNAAGATGQAMLSVCPTKCSLHTKQGPRLPRRQGKRSVSSLLSFTNWNVGVGGQWCAIWSGISAKAAGGSVLYQIRTSPSHSSNDLIQWRLVKAVVVQHSVTYPVNVSISTARHKKKNINLHEPCVLYIGRSHRYPPNTPFYIFFSTNIRTEFFKHAA